MPFSYLAPKRISALRLAQIIGTDTTTLEAAYVQTDIDNMLDGAEIPATAFKDAILYIAKEIAQVIGTNASHPFRSFLYARTADLADNAQTPTVDENGAEIVGVWDSCADAADDIPLTWMPTQTITDELNSFFDDIRIDHYNITGNYIRMTRPLAYLQGCKWSESDQSALYDSNGDCPLPESCLALLCDGVAERGLQVGWVDASNASGYYSGLYRQGLANLANMGQTNVPLASQNVVSG